MSAPFNTIAATMVSGATVATALDLGFAPSLLSISIGATSATTLYVKSAEKSSGGTYRRILLPGNGATAGTVLQHTMAASNVVLAVPPGHRFIQIETEAAISDGTTFRVIFS